MRQRRQTAGEDAVGLAKESLGGPSRVWDHMRRRRSGGKDGDNGVAGRRRQWRAWTGMGMRRRRWWWL